MGSRFSSPGYREFLLHGLAVLVCLLVLTRYFGLHRISLRIPLQYSKDSLVHLNWIKNIVDTGWYLHNDAFGAPGGQDLRGYPGADTLHHFTIKVLAWCTRDVFLLSNLFYLLTFPLTTVSCLWVLRRLGIHASIALVISLLFTFLPYHYCRLEHLFLSAYYHIPIACLCAIRLYQGHPFLAPEGDGRAKSHGYSTVLICALLGLGGAYYAFFGCWLFFLAGLAGAFRRRNSAPLLRAGTLVAGTFVFFLSAVLPTLIQQSVEGISADDVQRRASDSEWYGLKVTQMLIPIQDHRVPVLRRYALEYMTFMPLNNENSFSSLGLIASFGLLFLLGRVALQYRSAEPSSVLDALALLNMGAILLGTVGGLGSSFAFFCSPWIRCYNRISIFIGFFTLTAIALLLESARARWVSQGRGTLMFSLGMGLLLIAGLLDQTPRHRLADYEAEKNAFLSDRALAQQIAECVPAGRFVCQWPHRDYYVAHDIQLPLHAPTLRWTHGSLRGHEGDTWNRRLAGLPLEQQVVTLCRAEAGGICIDTPAYADRAEALIARLKQLLGPAILTSPDGRCVFFDLTAHTDRLKQTHSEADWASLRDRALHPPMLFWRGGFFEEEQGPLGPFRWAGRDGELMIRNDSQQTAGIRLQFTLTLPEDVLPSQVHIQSPLCEEWIPLTPKGQRFDRLVEIPPGTHTCRFATHARPRSSGKDMKRRPIVYMVSGIGCEIIASPEDEENWRRDLNCLCPAWTSP